MATAPTRLLLLAALGLSGCVRLGPDFQAEPVTWIEHWNSPALEQAEIRGALTQATRKVAVDPGPQCVADQHATGTQAHEQQQRSGA